MAVLSHALWTEMGGSPDLIGSTLRANGASFSVVGVAPATADARAVATRLESVDPGGPPAAEIRVVAARTRVAEAFGDVLRPLLIALGAVLALALLAAAANLANLLLGRATRRARELGIRAALGADRVRLGRLVAVETAVLVTVGLASGLVVSLLMLRGIAALELPNGVGLGTVRLRADGRLFLLAGCTLALTTLVVGLAPALFAARSRPTGLGSGRTECAEPTLRAPGSQ